jgi:hypothetical protein
MPKALAVVKLFLLLTFLLISGCQKEASTSSEPARPPSIPAASVWVGGLDGGVFVVIKKPEIQEQDVYLAEIYYLSGDLAYKGLMRLFPAGAVAFDSSKKESYEGWDGDTLYLSNNRHLKVHLKVNE